MARGRPQQDEDETPRPAMVRHMRALGFDYPVQYLHWCAEHGLEASLEKSPREREEELALPEKLRREAEARARIQNNPRKFLKQACLGEIDPANVSRPGWREVAHAIANSKEKEGQRESLMEFLLYLEKVSDLVFATAMYRRQALLYADALIRLHDRKRQWVRKAEDWKPESHNVKRQFGSLARHLLAKYDVPGFMDSSWLRGEPGAYRFRDWFIHLGMGKNIRTAKTPYPMTRMIAHHFTEAPADWPIEGALVLADIRSLGGSPRLAEAVMGTRLGARIERDKDRRAFWLSVYRFLIDNPMLDLRHCGPIVDFLTFQKFETQEVMVGPGRMERRAPPQPNLSMARRTADALLRQVEEWHGELRKTKRAAQHFWRGSGIPEFSLETGPKDDPQRRVTWRVRELLSTQELVDEGRVMRHCIASYADSCLSGRYSVWSMERTHTHGGVEETRKLLTISVDSKGQVTEARGFSNRWPEPQEVRVLDAWIAKGGLGRSPYLYVNRVPDEIQLRDRSG